MAEPTRLPRGAFDRSAFLRLRKGGNNLNALHPLNRLKVGIRDNKLNRRSSADDRAFYINTNQLRGNNNYLTNQLAYGDELRDDATEHNCRRYKRLSSQHLGDDGDLDGGLNLEIINGLINNDDLDSFEDNSDGRPLRALFSGVTCRGDVTDRRYRFTDGFQTGVGFADIDAITDGNNDDGLVGAAPGRGDLLRTPLIYSSGVYEEYTQVLRVDDLTRVLDEDNFDRTLFRFKENSPQIALLQHWLTSLHVSARSTDAVSTANMMGPGGSDLSRRLYERVYRAAVTFGRGFMDRAYVRGVGNDLMLDSANPLIPRSGLSGAQVPQDGRRVTEGNYIYFQLALQFEDQRNYNYLSNPGINGVAPVTHHQGRAFQGGIVYTSGAYRAFFSHHDWTAAWLSLYANLVHVYNGAGIHDFQDNLNRVVLGDGGDESIPIGFTNLSDNGVILGGNSAFYFVLRFIKPAEFNCFRQPRTESERQINSFLKKKQSVIFLQNRDSMCFFRGLAILFSRVMGASNNRNSTQLSAWHRRVLRRIHRDWAGSYKAVSNGRKIQEQLALRLGDFCGLNSYRVSVADLPIVADKFRICIRILNGRDKFKLLYEMGAEFPTTVYFIAVGDHLHPCWSYKGLLGRSYECLPCNISYNDQHAHTVCPRTCFYCRQKDCLSQTVDDSEKIWRKCDDCNRKFPTDDCFAKHLEPYLKSRVETSTCEEVLSCGGFNCPTFKRGDYADLSEHSCLHKRCKNCRKMCLLSKHQCYLMKKKPKKAPARICYFDFECSQESGTHVVTHAVVQNEDGSETKVFEPSASGCFKNVCNDFCEWVVGFGEHEGYTFIAHNGQGYDFHFIMKWALEHNQRPEKVIRVGQKIKHMVICGVRFLDSLSFLMMPLSAFPKTFGFKELAKGYFPHLFNISANQNYKGALPDMKYFMPNSMSLKGFELFKSWYDEELAKGEEYDFRREIVKYCVSDVDILRRGCGIFASLFQKVTGVHPFAHVTIASACLSVYRSKYLPEGDIRVLKPEIEQWIRQGFYGGRTNVMRVHVDHTVPPVHEGVEGCIKYMDVTSLYPYVNATCDYPIGESKFTEYKSAVIDGDEICEIIANTFGFLEVDVDCPRSLLHPVLPSRGETGRLLFDLTPKRNYVVCSEELKEALKHGYSVLAIYKTLHYEKRGNSLCRDYMLSFLKIKQEASGWKGKMIDGRDVETEEEKREWIAKYEVDEGVEIDYEAVQNNPGLRAVAKLCMNSLWGKLGQRPVSRAVSFCDNIADVYTILKNYKVYEVNSTEALSRTSPGIIHEIIHSHDKLGTPQPTSYDTNVGFAAFTTCYARLILYGALHKVGNRAIYCDTDSLIYEHFDNLPGISTGDHLGEWTDECDGDDIKEFVGVGPKTYSYITKSGKIEVKCKGFKIVSSNLHVLSFENFKKAMLHGCGKGTAYASETTSSRIVRDKRSKDIVTNPRFKKKFKATFMDKGNFDEETGRVLPYNYTG